MEHPGVRLARIRGSEIVGCLFTGCVESPAWVGVTEVARGGDMVRMAYGVPENEH